MRKQVAIIAVSLSIGASACVTSGTHQAVLDDLGRTRATLESTKNAKTALQGEKEQCDEKLTLAFDQNQQLISKVQDMGQDVEQLLGEKGELAQERERLAKEIEELRRMRAAADARNAEYQALMSRLNRMIDAGTLQVKVRDGRMLVQMSSDVVFPPGGTRIKPEAREAITELAQAMRQFADRKFLVVGHSDSTPISTARFPSNWELSTQRAIEVVKLMIEAGVQPEILSASGSAEFDPLIADDDDAESRSMNRRVEIVFLPKIDELPGFNQAAPSASR